jgi:hypothetical protein
LLQLKNPKAINKSAHAITRLKFISRKSKACLGALPIQLIGELRTSLVNDKV